MPGALAEWHELQHFTITADQQVCRYLETLQTAEVRVRAPVETIAEEILDLRPAEFARRQADAMNDDKFGLGARRTRIPVRAEAQARSFEQTGLRVHE